MWHEFGAALALLLVIEGVLPFANPAAVRRALQTMIELSDNQLRTAGLVSMLLGLLILGIVNH